MASTGETTHHGRAGRTLAVVVAAIAALSCAGTAQGVTCDYAQSAHVLDVRIQDSREIVVLDLAGGTIRVFGRVGQVNCTSNPAGLTPTVTNTNAVAVAGVFVSAPAAA